MNTAPDIRALHAISSMASTMQSQGLYMLSLTLLSLRGIPLRLPQVTFSLNITYKKYNEHKIYEDAKQLLNNILFQRRGKMPNQAISFLTSP